MNRYNCYPGNINLLHSMFLILGLDLCFFAKVIIAIAETQISPPRCKVIIASYLKINWDFYINLNYINLF